MRGLRRGAAGLLLGLGGDPRRREGSNTPLRDLVLAVDLDLVEEKLVLSDRRTEWDFGLLEARHLVVIF